jgi:hypothetical protein
MSGLSRETSPASTACLLPVGANSREEPGRKAIPAGDLASVSSAELRPHALSVDRSDDARDLGAAIDLGADRVSRHGREELRPDCREASARHGRPWQRSTDRVAAERPVVAGGRPGRVLPVRHLQRRLRGGAGRAGCRGAERSSYQEKDCDDAHRYESTRRRRPGNHSLTGYIHPRLVKPGRRGRVAIRRRVVVVIRPAVNSGSGI